MAKTPDLVVEMAVKIWYNFPILISMYFICKFQVKVFVHPVLTCIISNSKIR